MADNVGTESLRRKARRPVLVTLFAVVVLSIAILHFIRFIEAARLWGFLSSLPGVSPLYLAASGVIVALLSFPLALGLWFGHPRAPSAAQVYAIGYVLYEWIENIILARLGEKDVNWIFTLGLTVLFLVLTFWSLTRREAKVFFGEIHEQ